MTLPRRRTRVALLGAALTLLAAPVATAGSAQAGTWSHQDARGDVMSLSVDGEDGEPTIAKDADDTATDITRFTVKHGPRKVVLVLKVRDLRSGEGLLAGRIVTPRDDYEVSVLRSSDGRSFEIGSTAGDSSTPVPCRGKKQSFDTRRDKITITIPRVCLGNPKWVRAGAGYLRGDLTNFQDPVFTLDEALRTGSKEAAMSDASLKVGKKVRVG